MGRAVQGWDANMNAQDHKNVSQHISSYIGDISGLCLLDSTSLLSGSTLHVESEIIPNPLHELSRAGNSGRGSWDRFSSLELPLSAPQVVEV